MSFTARWGDAVGRPKMEVGEEGGWGICSALLGACCRKKALRGLYVSILAHIWDDGGGGGFKREEGRIGGRGGGEGG